MAKEIIFIDEATLTPEELEAIDNVLSELMENGEFDAMREEWLAQV